MSPARKAKADGVRASLAKRRLRMAKTNELAAQKRFERLERQRQRKIDRIVELEQIKRPTRKQTNELQRLLDEVY